MGDIVVYVVFVFKFLFWVMLFIGLALSNVYLAKKNKKINFDQFT
ncbi:hypothetical protein [Enterococcus mundtii]|nr:hypothetical protein [Enterococcus mundtii]MDV7745716.1 hypothetical protein [Enterococcus mundtii]